MAEPNENILYEIIQVPEATKVRFFTSVDPGSYVPSHWHRAVEIIYMLKGELEVTVERTSRILFDRPMHSHQLPMSYTPPSVPIPTKPLYWTDSPGIYGNLYS